MTKRAYYFVHDIEIPEEKARENALIEYQAKRIKAYQRLCEAQKKRIEVLEELCDKLMKKEKVED